MVDDATRLFHLMRTDLGFMLTRSSDEVVIDMVFAASRANMAGLMRLDVIRNIGGTEISKAEDLAVAFDRVVISEPVSIVVFRSGELVTFILPSVDSHRRDRSAKLLEEQRVDIVPARPPGVILVSCQFVHSGDNSGEGVLHKTSHGLEFVSSTGYRHLTRWSEIVDIQVATSATSRVTITRLLLIGIFALAAQKKQLLTVLEVETEFTTFAFVTTEAQSQVVETVRTLVERIRQSQTSEVKDSLVSDEVNGTTTSSLARQIRELADLRKEGLINDEEFAIGKAKILGV